MLVVHLPPTGSLEIGALSGDEPKPFLVLPCELLHGIDDCRYRCGPRPQRCRMGLECRHVRQLQQPGLDEARVGVPLQALGNGAEVALLGVASNTAEIAPVPPVCTEVVIDE